MPHWSVLQDGDVVRVSISDDGLMSAFVNDYTSMQVESFVPRAERKQVASKESPKQLPLVNIVGSVLENLRLPSSEIVLHKGISNAATVASDSISEIQERNYEIPEFSTKTLIAVKLYMQDKLSERCSTSLRHFHSAFKKVRTLCAIHADLSLKRFAATKVAPRASKEQP